jgi:hypothetical protein
VLLVTSFRISATKGTTAPFLVPDELVGPKFSLVRGPFLEEWPSKAIVHEHHFLGRSRPPNQEHASLHLGVGEESGV